jgi:uncharacterized Rossmann fold enzyme
MSNETDFDVDARPGVNGSNAQSCSRQNEADRSLTAALHDLVKQLGETNAHLMVLAGQTAKCLAHLSILIDIVLTDEDESATDATTYLDGSPIL